MPAGKCRGAGRWCGLGEVRAGRIRDAPVDDAMTKRPLLAAFAALPLAVCTENSIRLTHG